MNEATCDLDYKAEYLRLTDQLKKLECEAHYWKERCDEAERMRENLRFVIRTIEVIFGKDFNI